MTGATPLTTLFVLSTGMQALGSLLQTRAQMQAAEFNAALARQRAEQEERAKEIDLYQLKRRKRRLLGKQRALYAKAGLDIEGTPLEVLADTEAQFELDKRLAEYNREIAKRQAETESSFYKFRRRQLATLGLADVGSTLLTGALEYPLYKKINQ